ncbi:MAG: alpha-galactosidase, partial [Sphaerochaetaceae bacterium]|nr:alpha-galactosidase [Sphaerochaetaceae bacterium]
MRETSICVIGGGSRQWAITLFKDLSLNKMTHGKLVLHDIDHQAAVNNIDVANRIFAKNGAEGNFIVSAEKDLHKALVGADIVVISIEPGSTLLRYNDLVLPEQYGILQTVGDTTGPGGIIRARRAVPLFLNFGKAIGEVCPNAWVINYTNPMTLCTAALYRGFPKIKALGCCHEVFKFGHFFAKIVAKEFNVPEPDRREIALDITGVNHFTWITKASWNGIDLMPFAVAKAKDPNTYKDYTSVAKERIANEKWFDSDHIIALSLLRDMGALGAAGDRHLAEFVPWYLPSEEHLHTFGVVRTPYQWRVRKAKEKRNKVFTEEDLVAVPTDEEGVDIIRALMGDRTLLTNINVKNEGQISYLPKGRVVESNGFISNNSIRPIIANDPPLAVQNLIRHVSDVQEMTLNAIEKQDDDLLFAAFLSDPLC